MPSSQPPGSARAKGSPLLDDMDRFISLRLHVKRMGFPVWSVEEMT